MNLKINELFEFRLLKNIHQSELPFVYSAQTSTTSLPLLCTPDKKMFFFRKENTKGLS